MVPVWSLSIKLSLSFPLSGVSIMETNSPHLSQVDSGDVVIVNVNRVVNYMMTSGYPDGGRC